MDMKKANEIIDKATEKAMGNEEFRKSLVEDANKAIKSEYNEDLPIKVTFHEFDDKKLVFVLPKELVSDELSDDALGSVSGGVNLNLSKIRPAMHLMAYAAFPRITQRTDISKLLKK